MNNRIKELWYQAVQPHTGDSWAEQTAFMEKFAELIVRECMDLAFLEQKRYAEFTHRNMSECAVTVSNFRLLMKDHFGVEE
jgi:hypothetical protein